MTDKFTRWRLRLMEFDFDIISQSEAKHQAANVLSRLATEGTDDSGFKNDVPKMAIDTIV